MFSNSQFNYTRFGRISRIESLYPAWAGIKKALILTRLHWLPEDQR